MRAHVRKRYETKRTRGDAGWFGCWLAEKDVGAQEWKVGGAVRTLPGMLRAEPADALEWTGDVDNSDDHRDRNLEPLRAHSGVHFIQLREFWH